MRAARLRRDLSLDALAGLIGVKPATISAVERSADQPDPAVLQSVSFALGVTPEACISAAPVASFYQIGKRLALARAHASVHLEDACRTINRQPFMLKCIESGGCSHMRLSDVAKLAGLYGELAETIISAARCTCDDAIPPRKPRAAHQRTPKLSEQDARFQEAVSAAVTIARSHKANPAKVLISALAKLTPSGGSR
jgi:transcriptional regulator with XRE-family HTH domain